MIGRTLLHYEITAALGIGAMGSVYLARDTHTGRRVAIKVLSGRVAGPEARERLRREAAAAARLSHPGIVTLYSLEEAEGELFLVQELVEGETLAHRLERGPLGPVDAPRLARELAAALAHAHAHGVLHRDLKPENVLVTADGHFKIADFGIARIEGAATMTETGTAVGSLGYMAPERLSGARGDARSDLFALGAVLYEAMSGTRAFTGAHEAAVIYAVMNEEPPALEVSRSVEPLARLAMRLLAKDPQERPASAELVTGLLAEMETTRVAAARPRRGPAWLQMAAAAALLLVAAAGAWWARGHLANEAEAGQPALAVMAFDNVTDPEDRTRIGAITGSLLTTSLAQVSEINVLSTQRVLDAERQVGGRGAGAGREAALAVARRARATRTITGSILQTEPVIVITAEVADVKSGRVVHAVRIDGASGQSVFQVVDQLSARLLEKMARAGETQRLATVAQRTSTDLEAQRNYLEGLEQLSRGKYEAAIPTFEAALRRDPEFPQAHYQLAIAEWWNGEPLAAEASVERARRHADRLSPLEQAIVEGLEPLVDSDWSAAAERFAALAREHPGDKLILYGLEEATMHGRNWPGAVEAARQALAADPQFTLAGVHLVDGLKELGRYAEAESTAAALLSRSPANPALSAARFNNFLRQGNREGCERVGVAALSSGSLGGMDVDMALLAIAQDSTAAARRWVALENHPPWKLDLQLAVQAWALLRQGRFRESGRISERAWHLLPVSGPPGGPAIPVEEGLAAALALRDSARAMTIADSVQARIIRWLGPRGEIGGGSSQMVVMMRLGHPERARAMLARWEKLEPGRRGVGAQFLRTYRSFVLAAEGRPREAIDELEAGAMIGPPWLWDGGRRFLRARFHMAAGQFPVALGLIDTLLRAPVLSPDDAVRLHFYRGQCLEKLGRAPEAAASYREFLRIWDHADPGVPEVAEARSALARLGPAAAAPARGAAAGLAPSGR